MQTETEIPFDLYAFHRFFIFAYKLLTSSASENNETEEKFMQNKGNQNTPFIYSRSLKEKIPCTEEQFRDFYRMAGAIRKKEQYHHRCKCPKQFIWACDGDCENCEHHLGYKELSLEAPNTETGDSFMDMLPDESVSMEQVYEDRLLLEQLFQRLRELDPDADRIIAMWMANDKISDRAIAEALGRNQRTFADQMKRIRTELHKIYGR